MPTRPIAPDVLGPEVEHLLGREAAELLAVLRRAGHDVWSRTTGAGGSTVAEVVEHLTEEVEHVSRAWERHDLQADQPLFHAFEEPEHKPELVQSPDTPMQARDRYRRAMERLRRLMRRTRQEDWAWPSMTPRGGAETLAEAARRWLGHHYVHRQDVLAALGQPLDRHDSTVRLVVEFVLDALAKAGGEVVPRPMTFELVTATPGAGTWTLHFDEPDAIRRDDLEVWQALLGWRPDAPPDHRVERGSTEAARGTIRGDGELVWRAAFRRGGSWEDLEAHGDDEALRVWERL
ncbi:MAG: maleylpyruvate isomerase N-terminal domain-containing protein, partial [Actinomycetota bacterium]|nr:maleylpyruvate isomerase N-terminal domain-containing protein [Actinomycetota bacterium]